MSASRDDRGDHKRLPVLPRVADTEANLQQEGLDGFDIEVLLVAGVIALAGPGRGSVDHDEPAAGTEHLLYLRECVVDAVV